MGPCHRLAGSHRVGARRGRGEEVVNGRTPFTGIPGQYVPIRETVRGCKEILEGKHDALPEQAFYLIGTIDMAVEKAEKMAKEGAAA